MRYILTILFLSMMKITFAVDIIDDVTLAFKNGSSAALEKHFSSTVEIAVEGQENIYSSNQAELVLKDFFKKHVPINAKLIHKVSSNPNYKFGVIVLTTSQGSYRISFEIKNSSGRFIVSQIRIEENKG